MSRSCNVGEKHGLAKFEDTLVLALRKEFKEKRFIIRQRAEELNVLQNTLESALKGRTYKHLPDALTGNLCVKLSTKEVDDLRKEYTQNPFSIKDKAKQLGVHETTLAKRLKEVSSKYTNPPIKVILSSGNTFADLEDKVLDLRREYKAKPFSLTPKARELGVNVGTLSKALRGKIYKNIPEAVEIIPQPQYK